MLRFYPILWAFTALAGLASVHPALAASINGTVTLSPGGQPASGVWVSAVGWPAYGSRRLSCPLQRLSLGLHGILCITYIFTCVLCGNPFA